jgi:hypothetical protein
MSHWRTGRIASGGQPRPGLHISADTHAESNSFYSPLATELSFPRSQFAQAMLDILTLCVWMLFGLLGALILSGPAIVLVWILFFG